MSVEKDPTPARQTITPLPYPLRILLLCIGFISLGLGIAGIFLPVLPTTPFLLLSAGCFARSSTRFYNWLISHPKLGPYIEGYLNGKGIPLKAKIYSLLLMWPMMLFSAFYVLNNQTMQIVFPIIATLVSIYILTRPTLIIEESSNENRSPTTKV